jgi:hypothetical protein
MAASIDAFPSAQTELHYSSGRTNRRQPSQNPHHSLDRVVVRAAYSAPREFHQLQGRYIMKLAHVLTLGMTLAATATVMPSPLFAQQPAYTVVATGLNAPRGLRFGPDHNLYVAEAGTGGSNSTGTACTQVPGPVGPYTGGSTGRISKIDAQGNVTTVASGFPSTQDAMGDLIGVADVAFLNGTLYALVAGGGCSHGNPLSPSGIASVDVTTGKWTLIADIGAFLKTHPAEIENPGDFEPDGTLYSMIVRDGLLFTIEPNHGQMFSVSPAGAIREVIDISASEGHIVPTAVAWGYGSFYIGNLNLFPINPRWSRVLTVSTEDETDVLAPGFGRGFGRTHRAHIVNSKAGFTTVVAVDFSPADGLLYVLELNDAAGFPAPGNGKVVRVLYSGEIEDVVTGLNVPTGMTFARDGSLYVSDFGAVPAPGFGAGRILKFAVTPGM